MLNISFRMFFLQKKRTFGFFFFFVCFWKHSLIISDQNCCFKSFLNRFFYAFFLPSYDIDYCMLLSKFLCTWHCWNFGLEYAVQFCLEDVKTQVNKWINKKVEEIQNRKKNQKAKSFRKHCVVYTAETARMFLAHERKKPWRKI